MCGNAADDMRLDHVVGFVEAIALHMECKEWKECHCGKCRDCP